MASSVGPVQVKLELGHRATARRRPTPEGFTHDWCVSVRGPDGAAINHFVEKVVFHLHESFAKPKRVCREPPYKVEESGYAGFILPIEVYFKNKEEPRKVKFDYDLFLHLEGQPPVNHLRCEKLTFSNPPSDFRRRLLKAGGMMVSPDGMAVLSAPPDVPSSSHPEHRKPTASLHVKDFSKPIASLKPPKPFKGHKEKPSESKDYKAPPPGDGPSRESAKKTSARVHKPRDDPQPPPPATLPPKAPSKEPKALSKRDRSDASEGAEPAPVAAESREPKPASKRSRVSIDEKLDAKRVKKLPADVSSRQWAPVSSSSSSSSTSSSSSSSTSSTSVVTAAAAAAATTAATTSTSATEKVTPKERPSKGGDVDGSTRAKGKTTAVAPAPPPAPVPITVPAAVAPVPAEDRARDKTWRKKHEEVGPAAKPHGKSHSGKLRDKTVPAADREPPAERLSKAKDKLNPAPASVTAAMSVRQQPDRGVPKDRDAQGRAEATPNTKSHRKVADKEVVAMERKVAPALSPLGNALEAGDSDDELSLATDERPASVASGASSISHGAAPEPAQAELSIPEPLSVSPSEDEQEPPSAPKSSRSSELSDSEHSSDASPAPPILRHANKAYMEELVRLHRRLMMLRERSTLQQVVNLIEETGHFQVTSTTFDFDLFSLDQAIVRKLQSYLGPTEAV